MRKNQNAAASKKSRLNKKSKNKEMDDFDGDIEPDDDIMAWSPLHPVEDEAIDRIVNRVQKSRAAERKDLSKEYFDPDAVALLPRSIAEQFCLIPIRREGNELMVAFSDPSDEEALTEVVNMTGLSIAPVVADADEIEDAIEKYYEY